MKKINMIATLVAGLALGVAGGFICASSELATDNTSPASLFSESPLPGGGLRLPHNERLHLSTDQQWIYQEGHLSDLIRLQWTADRAKPAISWADENGKDKAAIIAHAKANNPEQPDHHHISIETTMSPDGEYANQLFTRLEIPFDQDQAEIRTHSSNLNVVDGILRVAGSEGVQRDLQFAKTEAGNVVTARWAIRADHAEETGGNAGSNLQIVRYSDEGEALDSPVYIDRSSGFIGIGNTDPTGRLDVNGDRIRIRDTMTPASSSAEGHAGDIAWDREYLYICVGENQWKRVKLGAF